jgi:hypothetical protein
VELARQEWEAFILKILAGMMVGVTQPFSEFFHVVVRELFLVGGSPER